jgi:hypothetical protein
MKYFSLKKSLDAIIVVPRMMGNINIVEPQRPADLMA